MLTEKSNGGTLKLRYEDRLVKGLGLGKLGKRIWIDEEGERCAKKIYQDWKFEIVILDLVKVGIPNWWNILN